MKNLLFLLFLLPFFAMGQMVNTPSQTNSTTKIVQTINQTTGVKDSLLVTNGTGVNGYVPVYNSTLKKSNWVNPTAFVPTGYADSLLKKANRTFDNVASGAIANVKLANSSLTIGSTNIALGATSTTLAGLTSVTSTTFVGALTGNATTASSTANLASSDNTSTGATFYPLIQAAINTTGVVYTSSTKFFFNPNTGLLTTTGLTSGTFNGNTITTGTGVLTLGAGKTLAVNNTLTLAGTDATTMTFPTTSATIARIDAGNTFVGVNTMTSPVFTTPAIGVATGTTLTNTSSSGGATTTLFAGINASNTANTRAAFTLSAAANSGATLRLATTKLGSGNLGGARFALDIMRNAALRETFAIDTTGNPVFNIATKMTAGSTGTVDMTFPTSSGTLATLAGSEALTNKTYAGSTASLTPTSSGSSTVAGLTITPSTSTHYIGAKLGNAWLAGRTSAAESYLTSNTDLFTATITGASSYIGQVSGALDWYSAPSVSAGASIVPVHYFGVAANGVTTIDQLAGTGNRIVQASSTGVLSATVTAPASGTYTPTLTNGANVSASTAVVSHYIRVGNEITVEGSVLVQPTVGVSTNTIIDFSLPVASAMTVADDLAGKGNGNGSTYALPGVITADATNDRATFSFPAIGTGSQFQIWFDFTYTVK